MELASDVDGLRMVMSSALGRDYRVRVADDGAVIGMWRIAAAPTKPVVR
jgi:hypothetical protein